MKITLNINLYYPIQCVIDKTFTEYIKVDDCRGCGNFDEQMDMVGVNFDNLLVYSKALKNAMLEERYGDNVEQLIKDYPDALLYWRSLIQNYKNR